jgi:hypothetical protein
LHRLDESRSQSLHGVSARLVPRLPGRHVPSDLLVVQRRDPDTAFLDGVLTGARAPREPHCRHDPVLPAGQHPKHVPGLGVVGGLSEDRSIQEDERVRREHPVFGPPRGGDGGFLPGQADGGVGTGFPGRDGLVDVGRRHQERNSERREDLRPARGRGGENEAGCHPVILRQILFRSFRGAKRRGIRRPEERSDEGSLSESKRSFASLRMTSYG